MVYDVRHQFRRRPLEYGANGPQDGLQRLLQRLAHLAGGDGDGAGQARDLVAAPHLVGQLLLQRQGRAQGDLDLLGGAVADDQVVATLDVVGDGLVQAVARHPHRLADDDAVEGDDCRLGAPAAYVHHHVTLGRINGYAGAQGGGQGLGDDVHGAPGPGRLARLLHRPPLHPRGPHRRADDHLRLDEGEAPHRLGDEVAQHGLGGQVVGDDPVAHGPDDLDGLGRPPLHLGRLVAHGHDAVAVAGHRHDGRLVDDDAPAPHVDENVGGAQVHAQLLA